MNRPTLFGYQLLTGVSDASTGALLMIAPAFALRLMHLSTPSDALTYVSFIGAFVLSVGLACLYGALLACHKGSRSRIEIGLAAYSLHTCRGRHFCHRAGFGEHARSWMVDGRHLRTGCVF